MINNLEIPDKILITSVFKLSADQVDKIKKSINKILKVDLPVENKIDSKLMGGFTIKVNDWFLDSSIKHEIDLIKRSLLE